MSPLLHKPFIILIALAMVVSACASLLPRAFDPLTEPEATSALPLLTSVLKPSATLVTPTPTSTPEPSPTTEGERAGWTLVWHDEFNGENLDQKNWTFDIGPDWGNSELQQYTNSPKNVRVENGQLIIEARQNINASAPYSSGRIKTQGLHSWQYGRVEARIKLPYGQGFWPAFWMKGDNFDSVGWPLCGEIDIMEFIGREPAHVYHAIHGPGYADTTGIVAHTELSETSLQNEFHVYAVEWDTAEIRWYVDNVETFQVTPKDVPGQWVFDHPFFIILNVAVGGDWPENPDGTTVFPQQMLVDYVRVYQKP